MGKKEKKKTGTVCQRPRLSVNAWRTMWGTLVIGLGLIGMTVYTVFTGFPGPAKSAGSVFAALIVMLGPLLIGLGLTAAAGTSLLTYYRNLTGEMLFQAGIVNRVGLMSLGPGVALISFPMILAEKSVTVGQCTLICIVISALSIVPGGISLVSLVRQHKKESKQEKKDPWE